VVGLPDGWSAVSVRNPASAAALGDPFGSRASIAFPIAQTGDCGLLYTVAVTATTEAQDITLEVVGGNPPSVPERPYPWLLDACEACTTFHQVDGGTLYINSDRQCTVGLGSKTWAHVKEFYR
jgi:hypothetical protein